MPHDRNGNILQVGDKVMVPCIIKSVTVDEDYCNVNLETMDPMPPYSCMSTLTLNTKQTIKQE